MNFFYSYLIQSSAGIILLYLVYWLFLKRDTFFMVNRFFLAGSILFSLIFPLFRWNIAMDGQPAPYVYLLDTVTITPDMVEAVVAPHLSILRIVIIVYLTGASLFLVRFVFQVYQVMKLVTEFGITRKQGIRMVFIDRNYQPFSFFGIVFIPENLKESDSLPQILEHERVHVRQVHSLDLLLMEILTILHWFNPFIWFYRRSLKSIHEYLADEGVIVKGYDKVNYQELLLGQTLGIQVNDLTNNFNHSLLKSRIIMMTKQRSGTFSGWKTTLAIPVLLGLVMIFSTSVYTGRSNENQQQDKLISAGGKPMPVLMASVYYPDEDSIKRASGKEPVYEVVKTMPEFQGGFDALVKYLVANIKYPEDAKKNGIQGTVFVSFVVEKDGKVSNVSLMKGVDPALDAEALRVVKTMPAWSPGLNDDGKAVNVRFNLPISFKLDGDAKKEEKK